MYRQPEVFAIAFSFPPDDTSGALRNLKILKYLPAAGWRMRVLTHSASPRQLEEGRSLVEQVPEECEVLRSPCVDSHEALGKLRGRLLPRRGAAPAGGETPKPSSPPWEATADESPGVVQAMKDLVSNCLSVPDRYASWLPMAIWTAAKSVRQRRPDVIYAVGKPWTSFLVGSALKRLFGIPLVIDFMDPWAAYTWAPPKSRLVRTTDRWLESLAVNQADFVIANTDTLQDNFIERLGVPPERTGVITCGFDHLDLDTGEDSGVEDEVIAPGGRFTITHTGTLYKRRNPLHFLKALKNLIKDGALSESDVRVNLVGRNEVEDPELGELLATSPLRDVVHQEGWVAHSDVMRYLADSHLLLLIQPDTKLQIPAKLYEYAATRRPVLALSDPEGAVDRMMTREGWGEVIPNDDVQAIQESLLRSYRAYRTHSLRLLPREGVERFSTAALARRLADILRSVSSPTSELHAEETVTA